MSNRISFHEQISRNKWKSFFLMLLIVGVFVVFGYVIGMALNPDYFWFILIIATVISIIYVWAGYYNSHKIALKSVNAREATRIEFPEFHNIVEGLSLASGMPKPKLYVMDNPNINAFASGRDPKNSVICVTTGALEKLDKHELEGVLGHELSHIANYDIRFMTLTAVLVGMIAIVSQIFLRSLFWRSFSGGNRDRDNRTQIVFIVIGILLAILAPIVVQLVQLGISRKREYAADASAVKFIRSPTGLIRALEKIERESVSRETREINKAVAPLFISDPFKKKVKNLFQTHPPLVKRIKILERM